jgi:hypothetical protein
MKGMSCKSCKGWKELHCFGGSLRAQRKELDYQVASEVRKVLCRMLELGRAKAVFFETCDGECRAVSKCQLFIL